MAVLACAPCLSSTITPLAVGSLTYLGLKRGQNKRKKKKVKKKKKITNVKKKKKTQKGGSGYETQEEHENMIKELNKDINDDITNTKKQREKQIKLEQHKLEIRKKYMRKECDKLVRLLKKKGVSQKVAEDYAQKMTDHKFHCDDGYIQSCDFCKTAYLKNLKTSKKKSKTPIVPQEALPKSKTKSKKKISRTRKKKKGSSESISMKLHAMGRTRKLKELKKSLTKKSPPPPPIKRSKSKNTLKKTKSTGGKSRSK